MTTPATVPSPAVEAALRAWGEQGRPGGPSTEAMAAVLAAALPSLLGAPGAFFEDVPPPADTDAPLTYLVPIVPEGAVVQSREYCYLCGRTEGNDYYRAVHGNDPTVCRYARHAQPADPADLVRSAVLRVLLDLDLYGDLMFAAAMSQRITGAVGEVIAIFTTPSDSNA